jgi:hypothetical protein
LLGDGPGVFSLHTRQQPQQIQPRSAPRLHLGKTPRDQGKQPVEGAVFNKVWAVLPGEQEAPQATSPEHSTQEVLVAAAVHGAVFGVVKAAVDRAGAKGFKTLTGTDPGK